MCSRHNNDGQRDGHTTLLACVIWAREGGMKAGRGRGCQATLCRGLDTPVQNLQSTTTIQSVQSVSQLAE